MEQRFGGDNVASVGTYTTMQLKGALKDVFRLYHNSSDDIKEINLVTSCLEMEDKTITDLFKRSVKEKKLYNFIKKYPYVIYDLPLVLNAPKAQSIHACATIIFPNDRDMYRWTPIYRNKDGILLTQFEGGEMDSSGFLKQDILGIKQLDKFQSILDRIEKNGKEKPDIYNLPFDDKNVYKFFSKGWNGDTFQFGTEGLTGYTRKLRPDNIDDLVACVALYRPGAMENGFHESYIKRKSGDEDVTYMWGTENALKSTFGIPIYQEQIMEICKQVAGFDLVTADDVRRALGKKKLDVLMKYKDMFIDGAVGNGCPKDEAEGMWSMMQEFAKYSFNLSHSASYGITGYISQWLKVNFPVEYWATALSFADDDKVPKFISEINQSGIVGIKPPDINRSGLTIAEDDSNLYWALTSIKGIAGIDKNKPEGGAAVIQIKNDKIKNGKYISFDNFLERNVFKGSKVTKTTIEGLLLSGAFDKLEGIVDARKREELLIKYRTERKVKVNEKTDWYGKNKEYLDQEWAWLLKQKRLSGLAFFDYEGLINKYLKKYDVLSNDFMSFDILKPTSGSVGGYVIEAIERKTKKGDPYVKLKVESNYTIFNVMMWSDTYLDLGYTASEMKDNIILLNGKASYDPAWTMSNQVQTDENSEVVLLKINI